MSPAMKLARVARPLSTRVQTASFSVAARRMAGGDAGAPRSGGAASGDAFTKREEASENLYIRNQEREKLAALKKKVADLEAEFEKDHGDKKEKK